MEEKILNCLSKSLTKKAITLQQLSHKVNEGSLKKVLEKQAVGYLRHRSKIEQYQIEQNYKKKKVSIIEKMLVNQRAKLLLVKKQNDSKAASKAIKWSTEEIINATKEMNKYPLMSERGKQIANAFIKFEQVNIDKYKEYLK